MNIEEYIQGLKKLKNELPAVLVNTAEAVAENDAVALVQERVQNTGKD